MCKTAQWKVTVDELKKEIEDCEYLLVGIGNEWKDASKTGEIYRDLSQWLNGKDYFIVTMLTDGRIFEGEFGLDAEKTVAPCGNENWFQCSESCTDDIWERGEIPDGKCPYCHSPLTENTVYAKKYIEKGYLPKWEAYKTWLSRTLNKKLFILELGVDFTFPTVIRWPFEKTAFFNEKSHMYRVNKTFFQVPEEMKERAVSLPVNSVELIREYVKKIK